MRNLSSRDNTENRGGRLEGRAKGVRGEEENRGKEDEQSPPEQEEVHEPCDVDPRA